MLRITVLSIVLTLASGQNAALLCKLWCDTHKAVATACHHQDGATSPSVTSGDDCDDLVLSLVAIVRQDVRPHGSARGADPALVESRFQFASSTDTSPGHDPGRHSSHEKPPLITALRI